MEEKKRYTLMVFPQGFDGEKLSLNIVLIPRNQDPFLPFATGLAAPNDTAAAFADFAPQFTLQIVAGLDEFPQSNATAAGSIPHPIPVVVKNAATKKLELQKIATAFAGRINLTGSDKATATVPEAQSVSKYLPLSYRSSFNFTTPSHENAKTDDSYHCAIRSKQAPVVTSNDDNVSWGQLYAHILRQPKLAEVCGMIYQVEVSVKDNPLLFKKGCYIYADIVNADYQSIQNILLEKDEGPFIKRYAARIPKLTSTSRPVFAPMVFPVLYKKSGGPDPDPQGEWDKIFAEVNDYNDGYAKIVHAVQPVSSNLLVEEQDGAHPVNDAGIRLAWDDEQLLIWYIRQLADNPVAPGSRVDAPLGVNGYRIDVRENIAGKKWNSLNKVKLNKQLTNHLQDIREEDTTIELPYQVYPTKFQQSAGAGYWLPMYFTNWIGKSLVIKDVDAIKIYRNDSAKGGLKDPTDRSVDANKLYDEVPSEAKLLYGHSYQFRVRLMDISGGGPVIEDPDNGPFNKSSSAVTTPLLFKRYVAPGLLRITQPDDIYNLKTTYYNETIAADNSSIFAANPVITINRPLLSYPAVVFTGKYQAKGLDPVQLLIAATGAGDGNNVAGIADPDVTKVEIKVEVETLRMDNLLSDSGTENYITLYKTFRNFSEDFDTALNLPVKFIDVNVLDLGKIDPFGDPQYNQAALDAMQEIILPTARKIRVSARSVCDGDETYFGFVSDGTDPAKLDPDHLLDSRYSKPIRFLFYKESSVETDLLQQKDNIPALQSIYLQPDPVFVNNGTIANRFLVREKESQMPDIVQRLAQQLGVTCNGLTLVAKKGERIVFGCSNKIRHHLSPDHSSITFSSKADLNNHWLGCLTYSLNRDWAWDALQDVSFQIGRTKKFKRQLESDPIEEIAVLGDIEIKHSASFEALLPDTYSEIDRKSSTLIFIDAIEPKDILTDSGVPRFPDEVVVDYTIKPVFKSNHATGGTTPVTIDELDLPTTINPVQTPVIVSAGIALSPYVQNDKYSATSPRQRYLWIELAEPVADPHDTLFCRVLANAPDQLLSNNERDLMTDVPEELPLAIDPEYIRVITPGQSDTRDGLSAMQPMEMSEDKIHYLLPLPPGLNPSSAELFGFFTYEFRIGHTHWTDRDDNLWSTAQGRFGRPLRLAGVQHPAPPLLCNVNRDNDRLSVNAPYAQAVHNGRDVTSRPPRTMLYALLYTQVRRADGGNNYRNILLDQKIMHRTLLTGIYGTTSHLNDPLTGRETTIGLKEDSGLIEDRIAKAKTGLSLKEVKDLIAGIDTTPDNTININELREENGDVLGQTLKPNTELLTQLKAAASIIKDLPATASTFWQNTLIQQKIELLGLPDDAPLSVLVVEVFDHITSTDELVTETRTNLGAYQFAARSEVYNDEDAAINQVITDKGALSGNLGEYRILRTSPLTEVPFVCCPAC
ncbi:hypothetical protein FO440_14875 [Mucilaginibacter corticis]|uniref:Uncharacterized protein n=1 Tax=Mucilaginibacter corticis TaxID=2597670 RepID=A0A556MM56_9SPHI|nr:hypothetical protein [Mucilaginibacter corticis]TSJ41014.1 hypothetical protein FO440_14875 [Mucilaginibacter corticis]